MKRDMDLVRQILIIMEEDNNPRGSGNIAVPGINSDVMAYHFKILRDAGLIEAIDASSTSGMHFMPTSLTWQGHEFIDAARNDGIWNKAKDIMLKKTGGMSLDVLKVLLTDLAKKAVLGV